MKTKMFTKWAAMIAVVATCFASAAMAKNFERQFDVKEGGLLDLKTDSGSVHVETHDSATALVRVEIGGRDAEDFEVYAELSGNKLRVKGEKSGFGWSSSLKVRFHVTLPKTFNVKIDTAGGSIRVDDLIGDLNAHTSGGSIQVGTIKGEVDLNTSGGSIRTERVYGPLNAHTSGGSIEATFAEQLTEDAELNTSGGSITAYLIPDIRVDLDASTSGGRVRTDFDVNGRIKKRSIRGEINGGGPKLRLHTSGGSVSVKEL